jgi:hypothetical protein
VCLNGKTATINGSSAEVAATAAIRRSVDLVVGDTTENISKPSLRVDTIELGRFDHLSRNSNLGPFLVARPVHLTSAFLTAYFPSSLLLLTNR